VRRAPPTSLQRVAAEAARQQQQGQLTPAIVAAACRTAPKVQNMCSYTSAPAAAPCRRAHARARLLCQHPVTTTVGSSQSNGAHLLAVQTTRLVQLPRKVSRKSQHTLNPILATPTVVGRARARPCGSSRHAQINSPGVHCGSHRTHTHWQCNAQTPPHAKHTCAAFRNTRSTKRHVMRSITAWCVRTRSSSARSWGCVCQHITTQVTLCCASGCQAALNTSQPKSNDHGAVHAPPHRHSQLGAPHASARTASTAAVQAAVSSVACVGSRTRGSRAATAAAV
jgi:hypothetical protein